MICIIINLISEAKSPLNPPMYLCRVFPYLQIDKDCYSRPCRKDEVCIPGHIPIGANTQDCSYSCMKISGE